MSVPTILIADPCVDFMEMLKPGLKEEGYTVLTASGGPQALLAWLHCETAIDLAVIDVDLPVIDAVRVAKHLVHERPDLKVIFTSAGLPFSALYGLSQIEGSILFLKPYTSLGLSQIIHSMLQPEA